MIETIRMLCQIHDTVFRALIKSIMVTRIKRDTKSVLCHGYSLKLIDAQDNIALDL